MVSMKPGINVEYSDKATVVTFTNEKILEQGEIQALQESIIPIIEQANEINLVLDFRNVRFLSSSVLGLLLRVSKKVYEKDGRLRLCGIDRKIYEIFKITRLNKIFDIYDDLEGALDSL